MSDEQQVKATIQTYLECMYESNADKAHAAFHPKAKIAGYVEDRFRELSVSDFANLVGSQQPSPQEKGESLRQSILSIEIAGHTAVARVRDEFLGNTHLDTLSLIRDGGKWYIYNKLFHVEAPSS